jgi:cytochrome c6
VGTQRSDATPGHWRSPLPCRTPTWLAKAGKTARCVFPETATVARAAACAVLLFAGLGAGVPTHAADVAQGAALYRQHCANCHGATGRPVLPMAPDFTRPTALLEPDVALLATIRAGRGAMPAYRGQLRDREILDIVAHLRTLR